MANLENEERNISLSIDLINNQYLDVDLQREDYENWIPFILSLNLENESYNYSEASGATLTIYEIERLLSLIEEMIVKKENNRVIEKYEFSSSECYFDLIFFDTFEVNLIYVEVWINIGSYTEGETIGYDKGFRFVVDLNSLGNFKNKINSQLNLLRAIES